MKLLVYSHDAFGLGNIRRMLAVCEHLLNRIDKLSILLISGSPMLQGFRLPKGLDYIKLPCLNRGSTGDVRVKYLGCNLDETVKLRSDIILSAVVNYQPDLLLVDKKPYGLKNELTAPLRYLQTTLPQTKLVLLLRDILDSPDTTITDWQKNGYYDAIEEFYDLVLVVGTPKVFDTVKEYKFPVGVARKVRYCGYIRRLPGLTSRTWIRQSLQVLPQDKLVLVTPGGGEDGDRLVKTYLYGLDLIPAEYKVKSLVVCGPEMPEDERREIERVAQSYPQVQIQEFTDDLISYVGAADAIVSMSGYNTICEILSLKKSAVIVPRTKPSQEQLIRAERMARLGLVKTLHPDNLNPKSLISEVLNQLNHHQATSDFDLDMNALPRITNYISMLLFSEQEKAKSQKLLVVSC